eukprot:CAMPEP_0168522070 /NCGR_PEP_ID=MMETSP0405-20121227/9069_1 /TAXON_ID=498012 /ORGANISM="Trichosphaerium sp, Strain Am-I-7 wt" /LENGTH=421 /DNA_ID=CAMNT_0008543483 /DNA_START=197 /DNA_END=1458 /DNA_ORIENTATION=-
MAIHESYLFMYKILYDSIQIEEGIEWKEQRIKEGVLCLNDARGFTVDGLVKLISHPANIACKPEFTVLKQFYRTNHYNVTSDVLCLIVGGLMTHPKFGITLVDELIRVYDKDPYGHRAYKTVQFLGFMLSNLPLSLQIASLNNNGFELTDEFKDQIDHLMPHHKDVILRAFSDRVIHCTATNESLQTLCCPRVKRTVNLFACVIKFKTEPNSIWDIKPRELAIERTLCTFEMFQKVNIGQFALYEENPREGIVKEIVDLFNELSLYVLYAVTSEKTSPQKRAERVTFFIQFVVELIKLGNTNDAMAVMSGLFRVKEQLEQTWNHLSESIKAKYNCANQLIDPSRGFNNLRRFISVLLNRLEPQVPYLGLYLTDLFWVNEGNRKTYTSNSKAYFSTVLWFFKLRHALSFYNSLQSEYPYAST